MSGQHDPIVDPAHESGRRELLDHRRRGRRRPGAPRRVRSASTHASSARGAGIEALATRPRREVPASIAAM